MFFWVFRFTENMYFPGPSPSLVELTGYDDTATSTVAVIRMSLKEYEWPLHIYTE